MLRDHAALQPRTVNGIPSQPREADLLVMARVMGQFRPAVVLENLSGVTLGTIQALPRHPLEAPRRRTNFLQIHQGRAQTSPRLVPLSRPLHPQEVLDLALTQSWAARDLAPTSWRQI
jgi:hypothetical protein